MVDDGNRWLRLAAEGVVIIASILLAFGIDAWWDARVERMRVEEALERLAEEIVVDRAELETAVARNRSRIDGLERFLRLSPEEISALPEDSVPSIAWLSTPSTFDPVGAALQSFVVGGSLNSIPEPRQRAALMAWAQLPEEIGDDWGLARESVLALREHAARHGVLLAGGVSPENPVYSAPSVAMALASLRRDREAVGTAGQVLRDYRTYTFELGLGPSIADDLLAALGR